MVDFSRIKKDFPIFEENPNLVYLDSTATSLKPKVVIDKLVEYYEKYSANIFRGVYQISEKATMEFEQTRSKVAKLINASPDEIVFTRNTTESINLIVYTLGREIIEKNDEILLSIMEHHSNFVAWQQLASENNAFLKIINIDQDGYLDIEGVRDKNINLILNSLANLISKKTKILSLTYISNVLGTINPIKQIIKAAKKINPKIITIVDAAQAVPHMEVDVKDLDCDFIAFSAHKMLGPTGVGVLYGKKNLLEQMYPFLFGGEMIREVYLARTVFKDPPHKFEAGTPAIGEVIGFGAAIDYLQKIGMSAIRRHEVQLTQFAILRLKEEFGDRIKIFGPESPEDRGGVIAFRFDRFHPHDVAQVLDEENIAVRAGHHCAMPLHQHLKVDGTVRASFYLYNDRNDLEKLVTGLKKVEQKLG